MSIGSAFASPGEAREAVRAGLGYLAGLDAASVPAEGLGRHVRDLVRADALLAAALAPVLAAYDARDGQAGDGQKMLRAWLVHLARVTRGQAAGCLAIRSLPRHHRRLLAGLRADAVTASEALQLARWTKVIPAEFRGRAGEIRIAAAPAGAGDLRTRPQRYHDALAEAMKWLLASSLLPTRAGQPVKTLVHVTFAGLCDLDAGSALQEAWVTAYRARWAARRAAASVSAGDGGAWLDGDTARRVACDAMLVPVVTCTMDPAAVEQLIGLCVQYDHLRRQAPDHTDATGDGTVPPDHPGPGSRSDPGAQTDPGGHVKPRRPRETPAATRTPTAARTPRSARPAPPDRQPAPAGPGRQPAAGGPGRCWPCSSTRSSPPSCRSSRAPAASPPSCAAT
jgi:hypothetical protein